MYTHAMHIFISSSDFDEPKKSRRLANIVDSCQKNIADVEEQSKKMYLVGDSHI